LQTGQLTWRDSAPQISKPLADFIDKLMAPTLAMRPQNAQEILRCTEQIVLHITLQRLKEIDSLTQLPFCKQEKPINSDLINPVVDKTVSPEYSVLSSEDYSRLQEILREFIGPIADTFLQQIEAQVNSPKELVDNLLLYLPPQERVEFKKKVMFLLQPTAEPPTKSTNSANTKNPAITESFIRQCEQELADLIGPIASFLVQKTWKFYPQFLKEN
jgi:serine/threonine-protein kinase